MPFITLKLANSSAPSPGCSFLRAWPCPSTDDSLMAAQGPVAFCRLTHGKLWSKPEVTVREKKAHSREKKRRILIQAMEHPLPGQSQTARWV